MTEGRIAPREPRGGVPAVAGPGSDLPVVSPRFPDEPRDSLRARADAVLTLRWLKQQCGGSESALRRAMARTDATPPSTSTIGQWSRGEVSSRKKSTRTAYAFDRFGRTLPGYPPAGRTLQAIVQHVAPAPRRPLVPGRRVETAGMSGASASTTPSAASATDGDTVGIDARMRLAPGEQVQGAEVTGLREISDGHSRQIVVTIVVTAVLVALVLAGVALFGSGREPARRGGPAVTPSRPDAPSAAVPTPRNDANLSAAATLTLDDQNFCSWHLGSNPIPLVSVAPLVMRIDARCNYPAQPDPGKDVGAAVYSTPTNTHADLAVGRLRDGSSFRPRCWVIGRRVTDGSAPVNSSRLWIRIDQPDGYVPDVNVGGGYTAAQLTGLGLPRCAR